MTIKICGCCKKPVGKDYYRPVGRNQNEDSENS